jgi:uncharacterized protein
MTRPVIPVANVDTKPFWDGCGEGRLLLQRCAGCGAWRHPPSPIGPTCLTPDHEWIAASGCGTVYTFVVTDLTDVAPEDVAIGMKVEVTFEELDGTTKLPLFRPRQEDPQ